MKIFWQCLWHNRFTFMTPKPSYEMQWNNVIPKNLSTSKVETRHSKVFKNIEKVFRLSLFLEEIKPSSDAENLWIIERSSNYLGARFKDV